MKLTNEQIEKINKLWESYFYPGTTTLKNKLGITDHDELKAKEAEISFEKLVELYENPIQGNFDKEHLKKIHKYILGDLFEWAGEYRYVNMSKQTDFTEYQNIDIYLDDLLKTMHQDLKQVKTKEYLAMFLATYYVHLIQIHPFREGNGRSTREFLRELVEVKSKEFTTGPLELDWSKFSGDIFLENLDFVFAFRGAIEAEFMKALVPAELEDEQKIKM